MFLHMTQKFSHDSLLGHQVSASRGSIWNAIKVEDTILLWEFIDLLNIVFDKYIYEISLDTFEIHV